MRSSWRAVKATDIVPIPPAATRAIGMRSSAKATARAINPSGPKKILGGAGGDSPVVLHANEILGFLVVEVARLYGV